MNITRFINVIKSTGSQIDLRHIEYRRISRELTRKPAELTAAESDKIAKAVVEATTTDEMSKALEMADQLIADKNIKFEWAVDRLPISSITWNDSRANISLRVNIPGTVKLPASRPANLPEVFGTSTWRNYCLVKDGALNIAVLPVALTKEAHDILTAEGVAIGPWLQGHIYQIDMAQFSIGDTKAIDENAFARLIEQDLVLTAAKKAIKHHLQKLKDQDKSKTLSELYGKESAEWLATMGITDGGWSPETETKQPGECQEVDGLEVKVKGGDIPSVNALRKKLDGGKKLNAGDQMLNKQMVDIQCVLDGKTEAEEVAVLEQMDKENRKALAANEAALGKIRLSIIADHVWFEGHTWDSVVTINHDGLTITVKAVKVKVQM